MEYRKEIDGLRAIAVLPVVFFHAGYEIFSGGFVGVDVFFVISGYLITRIILNELESGTFTLMKFYERRARRILPALFLVIAICIPFAWMLLLPSDIDKFFDSVLATIIFGSNVLFWRESGYFDSATELKPLLHTWSLAIEEQFYLIFPLFLLVTWKLGRHKVLLTLVLIAIGSFALAQWASYVRPTAAFYLLPMRAWELLVGAFVAFFLSRRPLANFSRPISEAGSLFGISLIIFPALAYSKATPFPGLYALAPTLGAALVILFSSQSTITGRFLGNRVLVGIGLISYSAYLWHQPVFSFARHISFSKPTSGMFALLSALVFILAYISWRFVEIPFRSEQVFNREKFFKLAAVGAAFLASFTLYDQTYERSLRSDRWAAISKIVDTKNQGATGFKYCQENKISSEFKHGLVCIIGDPTAPPSGVLWGDSYAGSALFGVNNHLMKAGKSFYAVLSDGCPPLPGISRKGNKFDCFYDRQKAFLDIFSANASLRDLIWIGRFRTIAGPNPNPEFFIDGEQATADSAKRKFSQATTQLIQSNKRVVFVLDVPNFEVPVPDYLFKSFIRNTQPDPKKLTVNLSEQRAATAFTPSFLKEFRSIAYIDSLDVFCNENTCSALLDSGWPLVVDTGHIGHEASNILAGQIVRALDQLP